MNEIFLLSDQIKNIFKFKISNLHQNISIIFFEVVVNF